VGKNGGVLALAGDDPLCKSSTLPKPLGVALYDASAHDLPGNVSEIRPRAARLHASRISGLWSA